MYEGKNQETHYLSNQCDSKKSQHKSIATTPKDQIICLLLRLLSMPLASEDIGHFKCDNDLELTRCAWLQSYHAYECVWVVEVAAS